MTDAYSLCERCGQRGSLALFRTPIPVVYETTRLGRPVSMDCYALALCVRCGIESRYSPFFESATLNVEAVGA